MQPPARDCSIRPGTRTRISFSTRALLIRLADHITKAISKDLGVGKELVGSAAYRSASAVTFKLNQRLHACVLLLRGLDAAF